MSALSDVWLLLDNSQLTFSAGSRKVLPANTGAWIGNTSSTIGGDISIVFQGMIQNEHSFGGGAE